VNIHYIHNTARLVGISCTVGSSLPKGAVNLILTLTASYTEVQRFIGNQVTTSVHNCTYYKHGTDG